jgi:uncharacterized protein YjbI with pentapeptide repeats
MAWRSIALIAVLAMALASSSGAEQVIPAREIIAKIEGKEPVHYDNIRILGDLNLKSLPDARVSNSFAITNSALIDASFEGITFAKDAVFFGTTLGNASFKKAVFLGKADFANTSFGKVSFIAASFVQPVIFDGALFLENVSFEDAMFAKDAIFNEARFMANTNFNYSDFASYSYFADTQFFGDALFSDVDFSGAVDFSAAAVAGKANFFQSRFGSAGFSDAVFSGPVQFSLSDFSGLSSFGGAVFAREANFNLARFSNAAYFSGAQFHGLALFGPTKFQDIASFQGALFEGDLNFKGGSIATILLNEAKFGRDSRIILNDTDFARFKAHWNEIESHFVFNRGSYLGMIKNYESLGWYDDSKNCYYSYRRASQREMQWGITKSLDLAEWLLYGYGLRPWYALCWSAVIILFFSLIMWGGKGLKKLKIQETIEKRSIDGSEQVIVNRILKEGQLAIIDYVLFSLTIFTSGFLSFLHPSTEYKPDNKYIQLTVMLRILGTLFISLLIAALTRTYLLR